MLTCAPLWYDSSQLKTLWPSFRQRTRLWLRSDRSLIVALVASLLTVRLTCCLVHLCFLLCDDLVKVVLGCGWVANKPHAPTHMFCLPCSHRCLSVNHEFLWPLTFKWDESKLPEFPGFHSHNDWLALEHVAWEHLNMPRISCWSRLPPESNTYSTCRSSCDWALIRDLGKIDGKC